MLFAAHCNKIAYKRIASAGGAWQIVLPLKYATGNIDLAAAAAAAVNASVRTMP